MGNPQFPKYQNDGQARSWGCFACCSVLDGELQESNYPEGRGKWSIKCTNCKCWTFFDLSDHAES